MRNAPTVSQEFRAILECHISPFMRNHVQHHFLDMCPYNCECNFISVIRNKVGFPLGK